MVKTPSFKVNLNQQKIILWYNQATIFIIIILYLGILITFSILPLSILSKLFHLNNDQYFKNIWFFCLTIFALGLIFSIISAISVLLTNYEEYINYKFHFIILNIISFNFLNLISNIIIYSYEIKVNDLLFNNTMKKKTIFN